MGIMVKFLGAEEKCWVQKENLWIS